MRDIVKSYLVEGPAERVIAIYLRSCVRRIILEFDSFTNLKGRLERVARISIKFEN